MPQKELTPHCRPVWLITGASSGIGRAIALQVQPWATVIAVGRRRESLQPLADAGCQTFQLDLNSSSEVLRRVVESVVDREGFIDVFVNAAGYILEGSIEETSDQDMQEVFETHVFGPLRLTRILLPYMRHARRGTIAHIAGIGGFRGALNAGAYCASKAALSTAVNALQQEVSSFGVRVSLVQLGHFRTSFLSPGHRRKVSWQTPDYDSVLEPVRQAFNAFDGSQPGDPQKGARVIVEALTRDPAEVPFLLPVGPDVPRADLQAYKARAEQMEAVKVWIGGTNHE